LNGFKTVVERTLLIIKPDAVRKKVVGKIISLVEDRGFEIAGIIMKRFTKEEARNFYKVHRGKSFYEVLVEFITSGPIVGILLQKENAVEELRKLVGATDPQESSPDTLRALYGTNVTENAVHASDSLESALYEIPFFFPEN